MNTRTTLIAIAVLMMAACSQIEMPVQEETPVALRYATVDASETKAAQNLNEGSFDMNETIKVMISNTGQNNWTLYNFGTGPSGEMVYTGANPPYYPAGSQNIDIVAYYPYNASTSFSVATDQTADEDYKGSDLMFASVTNQAKQAAPVELVFSHKMAKLNVNITAGTGVTEITSLSILNVKPTVSFDQTTGVVGNASGNAIAIAVSNNGAAIIPAQTISGGLLSIVTDKGTATYSVASKEFEAGKLYTLNITVNLRAVGTTTAITGWTSEGTVTVVAERPMIAGHEYVDMGNGLKWASCNLGASAPWEYGDYFQWGAIMPYYQAGYSQESPCTHWISGKTGHGWANYPFMEEGYADEKHITKYTRPEEYTISGAIWYDGNGHFIGDNKTQLELADDAARQRWGSTWRTPTQAEWDALENTGNYSWVWMTDYLGTGINGMLVTRLNGPCAGNSIFLPAAGVRKTPSYSTEDKLENAGVRGYYWSSSLHPDRSTSARNVAIESTGVSHSMNTIREYAESIRPVSE